MLGFLGEELNADAPTGSTAFYAHMAAASETDPVRRQLLSRPSTFYEPRSASGFVGLDNQFVSILHLHEVFPLMTRLPQRCHLLLEFVASAVFHDARASSRALRARR